MYNIFNAATDAYNAGDIDAIVGAYVPIKDWQEHARIVRMLPTPAAVAYGQALDTDNMPAVPDMRAAVHAALAWESCRRAGTIATDVCGQEILDAAPWNPLLLFSLWYRENNFYSNNLRRNGYCMAPCCTLLDAAALVSDYILPETAYLDLQFLGMLAKDRQGRPVAVLVSK